MKAEKIIELLINNLKKTRRHYKKLLKNFELEEIHDFRLQIKKLRAFIRLLNMESRKEKCIKINKEIRKFYRTTGKIRNVQLHKQKIIQLSRSLSFSDPINYIELINEEEDRDKKKGRRESEKISITRFKKALVKSVPEEVAIEAIQYFTIEERNKLLAILSFSVYDDETLHDVRKILKDILYDWDYLTPYLASVLPAYFVYKENIESLATKLGDFHDLYVALSFLSPVYIDQVINESEKDMIMVIKRKIEWEKYNTKEQIILLFEAIKKEIWVEDTIRKVCEIL